MNNNETIAELEKLERGIHKVIHSIESGSIKNLKHQVKTVMAIEQRILHTLINMLKENEEFAEFPDMPEFPDMDSNVSLQGLKDIFGMKDN